jgi:HYDIN/CFA65/VesB-like, Ig-like domain
VESQGSEEKACRDGVPMRKTNLYINLTVLLLAATGAYWVGSNPARVRSKEGRLLVDLAALNFGRTWEDSAFKWDLPVRNPGATDVKIVTFATSCRCVSIEPQQLLVRAGETQYVHLTLDLHNLSSGPAQAEEALFSSTIQGELAGLHGETFRPVMWTIQGRVRRLFTVSPPVLTFSHPLIEGEPFPSRDIQIVSHTRLSRLKASCEPDLGVLVLQPDAKDPLKYALRVRPKPDLQAGLFSFRVLLHPEALEGRLPLFAIPVEGRVNTDLQLSPTFLQFATHRVGDRVREHVVLSSLSRKPFKIERIVNGVPGVTVEPVTIEADLKEYCVTQHIAKAGNQTGTVLFHVRPQAGFPVVLSLRVGYFGL